MSQTHLHKLKATHQGMWLNRSPDCSEFQKLQQDQDKLKDWMINSGAKVCPTPSSCGVIIEKQGGCNQVKCEMCRMNICWACLAIFPGTFNGYWACTAHIFLENHGHEQEELGDIALEGLELLEPLEQDDWVQWLAVKSGTLEGEIQ